MDQSHGSIALLLERRGERRGADPKEDGHVVMWHTHATLPCRLALLRCHSETTTAKRSARQGTRVPVVRRLLTRSGWFLEHPLATTSPVSWTYLHFTPATRSTRQECPPPPPLSASSPRVVSGTGSGIAIPPPRSGGRLSRTSPSLLSTAATSSPVLSSAPRTSWFAPARLWWFLGPAAQAWSPIIHSNGALDDRSRGVLWGSSRDRGLFPARGT